MSASYYALFHLLVDEASRRLVGGANRASLRTSLGRAFNHGAMRTVAKQFAARAVSPRLDPGLNGQTLQERDISAESRCA